MQSSERYAVGALLVISCALAAPAAADPIDVHADLRPQVEALSSMHKGRAWRTRLRRERA
jgi:hypothetical protein